MIYLEGEVPPKMFDYVVEFLDIKHAQKSRHKHYIRVKVRAPMDAVAARLGWDVLQEKIGRVPFKSDFHQVSVVLRG